MDVGTVVALPSATVRHPATPLRTLERNAKKNADVRILAALAAELGAVEILSACRGP